MNTTTIPLFLSNSERSQIEDILRRRANDIASFKSDMEKVAGKDLNNFPGSVEMALSRELKRLRNLAEKVAVPASKEEEDEA